MLDLIYKVLLDSTHKLFLFFNLTFHPRLKKRIKYILSIKEDNLSNPTNGVDERVLPGFNYLIKSIHYIYILNRYFIALRFTKNKTVLDVGSGLGWGSFILSTNAKSVIGLDINSESIKFSNKIWISDNLNFIERDINNLNIKKKFDVITAMEVIEHLNRADAIKFLKCSYNLCNKKGHLIMSSHFTKNRKQSNELLKSNPHHLYIFTKRELKKILGEIGYRRIIFLGGWMVICKK